MYMCVCVCVCTAPRLTRFAIFCIFIALAFPFLVKINLLNNFYFFELFEFYFFSFNLFYILLFSEYYDIKIERSET